jgi:endo-1,4-beta-D-glucanase Y
MTSCRRAALLLLLFVAAGCGRDVRHTLPSSAEARLEALWNAYQRNYMTPEGDVRDPLRAGRVTSEGQSYALLQAAWLRDAQTFERVLHWTNHHLRRSDGLYSWLWDPRNGGRVADANTATDADTDIAFALIVASAAFDSRDYDMQAQQLVKAIRASASLPLGTDWFPSAGNWARSERIINLSYFAPYAYRYFERLDPGAGWTRAIEIGYELLAKSTSGSPSRLPPDFAALTTSGEIEPIESSHAFSQEFSYDAVRVPWRIDLDCRLHAEPRACAPQPLVARLTQLLSRDGRLVSRYSVDGVMATREESLSFYGALLPAFSRQQSVIARDWRKSRFSDDALTRLSAARNRYYDVNWVWFGLAAADGVITARTPPLTATNGVGKRN